MKMVYDEAYGELSYKQRATYRKYNVSGSDHDMLVARYGDDHEKIVKAVIANSPDGYFSCYTFSKTGW